MRRLWIAIPLLAVIGQPSLAGAAEATAPAGNAHMERKTEGRAAADEQAKPSSPASRDNDSTNATPGPGMPPRSEAKGP